MKKYLLGGLCIILIVVVAIIVRRASDVSAALPSIDDESAVWVEVVAPPVTKTPYVDENSLAEVIEAPLATGDRLSAGDTVKVGEEGFARVYFPDGSNMDVDGGTTLTLKEASHTENADTFVVRIALAAGSVWSRVIALATPESQWSVEAGNAVVTVRGTTFGVSHGDEITEVIGGENSVELATNIATTTIGEDEYATVDTDTIGAPQIEKEKTPDSVRGRPFVKKALNDDRDFKELRKKLRDEEGLRGKALRKALRAHIRDRVIERMKKGSSESEEVSTEDKTLVEETPSEEQTQTSDESTPPPPPPAKVAEVIRIEVRSNNSLQNVHEGDTLVFEAVAYVSDGTSRVITKEVSWQILGKIGAFTAPGTFVAELNDTDAEVGKVPGEIVATFHGDSGVVFTGRTPGFFVYPVVPDNVERQG